MPEFEVLEPAIDPNNRIGFLLDWELTMKCNLDCSYCLKGIYGGHDNSTQHPAFTDCLKTIDFMFSYVDLYMKTKPRSLRHVILNIYGGESLHHPDIVEILQQVRQRYQSYVGRWNLTVTTTTNAIVSKKRMEKIIPYIDEFTASYHTENTNKQKKQFKDNLLTISKNGKRLKCVVLMHQEPELFEDAQDMITWLKNNEIRMIPRQLDGHTGVDNDDKKRVYAQNEVKWFNNFYKSKTFGKFNNIIDEDKNLELSDVGRACCGGRQLCQDQDYKQRQFYVENKFPDWYCSVNHFFVYIKQITGDVFINRDCQMNFEGSVGPIGNLQSSDSILDTLRIQLETNTMPIIQCKKSKCICGLCAPKAQKLDTYKSIMEKYQA